MTVSVQSGAGRFGGERSGFALGLLALGLMLLAIAPAATLMTRMWEQAEYSHAWLIVPLATLIFVDRFSTAARGGNRSLGSVFACASILLMLAGWATRNTTLSIYGGITGLYGLAWASVGSRGMRTLTAPIAFLIFMIPLPLAVYISLSQAMQLVSSKLGVSLMEMLGVAVVRDGNIIELANGRLEVAEACNGLRYLFPLLSISFLLAVLSEDRAWKKTIIFLSGFPIAIVMNAIRLALIGILVDRYGIGMAQGTQHEVEGFAVFALCVGLLVLEVQLLAGGSRGRGALAIDRLIPGRRTLVALTRCPVPRAFVVASGLLATGALLVCSLPDRVEIIPDRRPLSLFPMSLAGWRGIPRPMDPQVLGALQLTDYVMADYVNRGAGVDRPVNFYVAYYASQRIGVQVHSPRLCIPGGGWDVTGQTVVDVPIADNAIIRVNRVRIEKQAVRQIVYYWFDERGRSLTTEAETKIYALVDAVQRNRSDGALVRLVAPVNGDDEEKADRDLQAFLAAARPRLRDFVPG